MKAQEYLQKGYDHHKTWHLIEIVYLSLSLELVTPYVKVYQLGLVLQQKDTGIGART